jgi:hypothetical protein
MRKCLLLTGIIAAAACPVTGSAQGGPSTVRVTLQKGADLESVVRGLERAFPGVVVADVSGVHSRLTSDLVEVPLDDALNKISRDFDRYCMTRGNTLVLQRRFSNPDDGPGTELDELRQAVADMYNLIRPFSPGPLDIRYIQDQNEFAASLTPEQQQIAMRDGLPLTQLPKAQRAAWMKINAAKAFSLPAHELRNAAQALAAWERAQLVDVMQLGEPRVQLAVKYPDPEQPDGVGAVIQSVPRFNLRPRNVISETLNLAVPSVPPPRALRSTWALPAQQLTLAALAKKMQDEGAIKLKVPEYAIGREFWIASRRGTRSEVLSALCDLWGWELTASGDGYRIGRGRFQAAKDPIDLQRKLRAAVPPPLWHMIRALDEGANDRLARDMEALLQDAARKGGAN